MAKRGKGPLRIAFEDFYQTFIYEKIAKPIKVNILLSVRSWLKNTLVGLFEGIGAESYARQIGSILDDFDEDDSLTAIMSAIPTAWGLLVTIVTGGLASVPVQMMIYAQNRIFEPYRADISSYSQMAFRHPSSEERFKDEALDLGIPDDLYDYFKSIYRPLMSPTELMFAYNREFIQQDIFDKELSKQGWLPEQIDVFDKLRFQIPPIQDLIRFTVREAFSPDIIAKFGYNKDFPDEVLEYTKQLGLTEDWVKRYWYAHWYLPSATQGYEMLHRLRPGVSNNPFTKEDLRDLLRANDIPEFYRDRLIEISYNPFTRVDIRRMRRLNILDYEGVKEAYLDSGYNEERATQLADFVEKEYGSERRELTRTMVQRGYENGMLSREDALSRLVTLGYSQVNAEFVLSLVDFKLIEEEVEDNIKLISETFLRGLENINTTRDKLNGLGITSVRVDSLIARLERIRENSERFPSETRFGQLFKSDIISESELREEFQRMNYSNKNIDRLIAYYKGE